MANKALLIGINNYESIGDLRGCHNDVANVRDILVHYFDFLPDNISLLVDGSATKERINKRVGWLFKDVDPDDEVVLHFSGHGSFIRDFDGDEALRKFKDEVDELICLFDMDWRDPNSYLVDDELGSIAKKLPKGTRLTVILDSCHSGTGTRTIVPPAELAPSSPSDYGAGSSAVRGGFGTPGGGGGFGSPRGFATPGGGGGFGTPPAVSRFAEPPVDIMARIDERQPPRIRRIVRPQPETKLNHILLAGCREDQTSADAYIGGTYNGAFTYYLCKTIRDANARITYGTLIQRVRQSLRFNGFAQVAQCEGPDTDGLVFGGT